MRVFVAGAGCGPGESRGCVEAVTGVPEGQWHLPVSASEPRRLLRGQRRNAAHCAL